jgi:hypothetical protein
MPKVIGSQLFLPGGEGRNSLGWVIADFDEEGGRFVEEDLGEELASGIEVFKWRSGSKGGFGV